VTTALQAYADRGVFRGFSVTPLPRGRVAYHFHWLLRPPMRLVLDVTAGTLTAPALFPGVARSSPISAALDAIVSARTARRQPAHKRLDGRRARVISAVRGGGWTLTVTIRGAHHRYAVQHALNLINELFLFLQESWPEYLIEHFGLSPE
jgi:hypothetical protein